MTYNRTGDPAQANANNGLDERVGVTSASVTRSYVYDPDGRLLGEYDSATGAPVAETIWMTPEVANDNQPFGGDDGIGGYAPLAVATGSGASVALYWVHGNHMGVPTVTTNASGTVATPPAYTMAGFPGQTKTLSDIYYNRYRDYDSSTGRYIQADPIGLGGGSNPHLYAGANPLRFTDPTGQFVPLVIAGVCAGGGCEAPAHSRLRWGSPPGIGTRMRLQGRGLSSPTAPRCLWRKAGSRTWKTTGPEKPACNLIHAIGCASSIMIQTFPKRRNEILIRQESS